MKAINDFCIWYFEPLKGEVSAKDIWSWWRHRQLFYNLVIIVTACISYFAFEYFAHASGLLKPGDDAEEPIGLLLALIVGPIAWNMCYCLGPICEVFMHNRVIRKFSNPFLLKAGLAISMALVCIPSSVWFVLWVLQAFKGFPKNYTQ